MWTPHEIRNHLEDLQDRFHFKMPQMQTLLCQERFLLRLYQLKEGKNYIWKGGSLLVRRYQALHQKPRWTVDLYRSGLKVHAFVFLDSRFRGNDSTGRAAAEKTENLKHDRYRSGSMENQYVKNRSCFKKSNGY